MGIVALTFFECDSTRVVLTQGMERVMVVKAGQAVGSAFIGFAVLLFVAHRRNIQGKLKQWSLLGAILFLKLLMARVIMLFSFISGEIENALHENNEHAYNEVLQRFGYLLCMGFVVSSLNRYARLKLVRHWREFLTVVLVKHYMAHKTYYRLDSNSVDTEVDNPDQRITEDVKYFTDEFLNLLLDLLSSLMNLAYTSCSSKF
jgi:putative ATP-binding cassette transporter